MKKLKPPPFNARRVLRAPLREAVNAFDARDHGVDELLNLLDDIDHYEDGTVELRAVAVLVALGASADVVGCYVDLIFDLGVVLSEEVSREAIVLMSIGRGVGELADIDTVRIILDALDARLAANTLPPGWHDLVDVLAAFMRRGQREPRSWEWLERVRQDDPFVWSRLITGTGDERAVPPLQELLASLDSGLDGGDANVAWRARTVLAALQSFGPLNEVDAARELRALALLASLAPPTAAV